MPRRSARLEVKQQIILQDVLSVNDVLNNSNQTNAEIEIPVPVQLSEFSRKSSASNDDGVESGSDSDILVDMIADKLLNKLKDATPTHTVSSRYTGTTSSNENGSTQKMDETELPSIDVGDIDTDGYITVESTRSHETKKKNILDIFTSENDSTLLKHSIITPDFETKHIIPKEKSKRSQKRNNQLERKSSSGKNWYNMKAPEITEDVKRDLKILQMRSILDPKRFYKHNDRKTLPKYFQLGKIMDNAADFYSSRLPKKARKKTLTDELLADANFKKYQKRKYKEIDAKRRALAGKKYFPKSKLSKHPKTS